MVFANDFSPNAPIFVKFPVIFPDSRELEGETGSLATAPSASYYVLDIAYIIVFLGSLFSREFAGVTLDHEPDIYPVLGLPLAPPASMLFGFLAVASCDKTSRAMAVMLACSLRICAGGRITTVRVTRALHFVRLPSGASVFSSSCLTPSIAGSNPAPTASY